MKEINRYCRVPDIFEVVDGNSNAMNTERHKDIFIGAIRSDEMRNEMRDLKCGGKYEQEIC